MKKQDFFTMVQKRGAIEIEMQHGYTDGTYNYYLSKTIHKWYCIDPRTGIAIASGKTKQDMLKNTEAVQGQFAEYQFKRIYYDLAEMFAKLRLCGGVISQNEWRALYKNGEKV